MQTTVNGTLNGVSGVPLLGILPSPLSINLTGLLATAASGSPITLQAISNNGTILGPSTECNATADGYILDTPAGIAIGGNHITGLGATGQEASAGEIDSIALGNRATTNAAATDAIAIGADASVGAAATGGVALGSGAGVTAANGVALGAGSVANRAALTGYTAFGLATPQNSAGAVSVGATGATRQIINVAPGTAPTDAANMGQLLGLAALIPSDPVLYDSAAHAAISLTGAGGTLVTNVAPGTLSALSDDAVNGSQLFATNQQVLANTNAITSISVAAGGAVSPVQYSNPGSPTTANGGIPTNDTTLVGGAAGPVALHNVAAGSIAAGSTDAVNGGQVYNVALAAQNSVQYGTDPGGNRTNDIALVGGNAAAPVTISNVGAGTVSATSTDGVNGGQLYIVQQATVEAQATADQALSLNQNAVQYDNDGHGSVTLGNAGTPTALHNVAAGSASTDAVNVGQLNGAVTAANAYTDARLSQFNFDVRSVERSARAGTAASLAAAALPQAMTAGGGMISVGVGTYRGRNAMAIGASKALPNGKAVFKVGMTYDSTEHVGANAGVGFGF